MKAELNNCFIIIQKIIQFPKGETELFVFCSPKITQPHPQVFSVKGSIICSGLHFRYHFDVIGSIICSRLHFWLHWFNVTKNFPNLVNSSWLWWITLCACGFNWLSESGKYIEWMIKTIIIGWGVFDIQNNQGHLRLITLTKTLIILNRIYRPLLIWLITLYWLRD